MAEKQVFPGQQEDEKIIIFERRHWYILFEWLQIPLLLLLASFLIVWGIIHLGRSWVWLFMLAPVLLWIIWRILDWENDRYIVTDKRVIHIERVYFIREKRDEAPLDMIQDVSVEMPGLMRNLLYFGNVIIQTAGTLGTIRFMGIKKPRKAQSQILTLVAQTKERKQGKKDQKVVELRWESEKPRRQQLSEVIKRMFFPKPVFGRNQIIWRKHWWVLLGKVFSPLLLFAVLTILWFSASTLWGPSLWFDAPFGFFAAITFVWLVWRIIDWWNDLYVITDERVVDIEKVPLIYEHRREAGLGRIQDVRYLQPNFIAKTLDFGNVRLETAGEVGAFTFDNVPHPRTVQAKIFERLDAFRRKIEQAEEEREKRRQQEIIAMVEEVLRRRTSEASEG